MLVMRHSPYGGALARAAIDMAMAMGAFEQDFELLFMGKGVLQLLDNQDSHQIGLRNAGRLLSSLPLYDVERVFVDADALQHHGIGLADLVVPAEPLDAAAIRALLATADHLVSC